MTVRLDAIAALINQLSRSFADPAVPAPGNAEIREALDTLARITNKRWLYAQFLLDQARPPLLLKPKLADDMAALLAEARAVLAADTARRADFTYAQAPLGIRWGSFLAGAALVGYGLLGIHYDDLYIPGKRSGGLHLHGLPIWLMFAAILCAALLLGSAVADRYDRRGNGRHNRALARCCKVAAWSLLAAALALDVAVKLQLVAL